MADIKFKQSEIKNIIKINNQLRYILSDIPKAMYSCTFWDFLCDCKPDAIESMAKTVLDLYWYDISTHQYIWDLNLFQASLKKITSQNIKKGMSSNTYKKYVMQMIGCCYPSACQHIGLMLILNTDYKSDWKDIHNYFLLWEYKPQDREKYRYRPAIRQVKTPKPLIDKKITNALQYSGHSKNPLFYNLKYMNEDQYQGFIHILCGLQALREDYNFFDKQLLGKVVADYWAKEYEKSLTEDDKRALNAGEDINFLEATLIMVETKKQNKDLEINGERYYPKTDSDRDYDKEIRQLEEQIKEIKQFVEQYEADYDEWIKPIYEGFDDKKDIWPTIEQCNALGQTYQRSHDVLLNTIAVLVHKIPRKDWDRIMAYYAEPDPRIKLAENPILDKDSGDPYIIHPKLERPITDKLVKGLEFNPKYKYTTVEQIDIQWEDKSKTNERQGLMYIIFVLQTNGVEFIVPEIFSEVFKKQIESDKNGGPYFWIDSEMIDYVIKNVCSDKKDEVCEIAILLDKGYKAEEVGRYFQKKLLKGENAGG